MLGTRCSSLVTAMSSAVKSALQSREVSIERGRWTKEWMTSTSPWGGSRPQSAEWCWPGRAPWAQADPRSLRARVSRNRTRALITACRYGRHAQATKRQHSRGIALSQYDLGPTHAKTSCAIVHVERPVAILEEPDEVVLSVVVFSLVSLSLRRRSSGDHAGRIMQVGKVRVSM
jgi:hypothetical protein